MKKTYQFIASILLLTLFISPFAELQAQEPTPEQIKQQQEFAAAEQKMMAEEEAQKAALAKQQQEFAATEQKMMAEQASQVNSAQKTLLNSPTQAGVPYDGSNKAKMNYSSAASGCVGKIVGKYVANYLGTYITKMAGSALSGVTSWLGGLFKSKSSGSGSSAAGGTAGAGGAAVQNVPTYSQAEHQTAQGIESEAKVINKATSAQEAQENFLKPLAVCVANELIQQMTAATVDWINNGFKNADGTKGPAFVSNPKQFFTGIADREAGGFFQSLGPVGSLVCKPFDIKVRLALLNDYRGTNMGQQCTLTSIKDNVQNFGKGNNGGDYWNDWFELTQKDQNNAIGSYFIARDKLAENIQYNEDINRLEVTIGRGFLDMKKCVKKKPDGKTCQEWTNTTPGTEVQASLDRVLNIQGERINIANSFDDIVEALINLLLKKTLGGLSGK